VNRTRTMLLAAAALAILGACGSDAKASPPVASDAQPSTTASRAAAEPSGPTSSSSYCALFIDFANWSLANTAAVTAEAAESTFTVRDAFFAESLVRMAAMQKVEPTELHDALSTFAKYAQLYRAHDLGAVVGQTKAMTPAAALINGYGKTVCGYDPQVVTSR
jgi:hypothetical protein